jgi:hypothetical protein
MSTDENPRRARPKTASIDPKVRGAIVAALELPALDAELFSDRATGTSETLMEWHSGRYKIHVTATYMASRDDARMLLHSYRSNVAERAGPGEILQAVADEAYFWTMPTVAAVFLHHGAAHVLVHVSEVTEWEAEMVAKARMTRRLAAMFPGAVATRHSVEVRVAAPTDLGDRPTAAADTKSRDALARRIATVVGTALQMAASGQD